MRQALPSSMSIYVRSSIRTLGFVKTTVFDGLYVNKRGVCIKPCTILSFFPLFLFYFYKKAVHSVIGLVGGWLLGRSLCNQIGWLRWRKDDQLFRLHIRVQSSNSSRSFHYFSMINESVWGLVINSNPDNIGILASWKPAARSPVVYLKQTGKCGVW